MAKTLYRPPEAVIPFVASMPAPVAGESLLGLLSRCAGRTTVRILDNLLALGGLRRGMPGSVATTLTDEAEIVSLARLLKTDPEEIRARTYKVGVFAHTYSDTIDFFGVQIRTQYRNIGDGRRRVSPRALEISQHHRAIWEITAFSFDPETMETLLTRCPVCGRELGFRRLQGITKCDWCRDGEGRPNVDLRDFLQPIVEVGDPEALRFVVDLIDPIADHKRRARRLLKEPWSGFSNSELFEAIMALGSGLSASPSSYAGQGRPKNLEQFARLRPEYLASAGRAIIGGPSGFASLAEAYRKHRHQRRGFYGLRKEFGPLSYVGGDRHLVPGVAELIRTQLQTYFSSLAVTPVGAGSASEFGPAPSGFYTIQTLSRKLEVSRKLLTRLARSGMVTVNKAHGTRRSPIRMSLDEVAPIIAQYNDSILEKDAAGRLGVPRYLLPGLAELGQLELLSGPVLSITQGSSVYRLSRVEKFRDKFWGKIGSHSPEDALVLQRAATALGVKRPPWLKIIVAILEGRLAVWSKRSRRRSILKHLWVRDAEALAVAIRTGDKIEEEARPAWIDIATAADMLNVNQAFVWRLAKVRPKLLPKYENGYTPFRTEEVDELARSHIFVPEISRRTGIIPRMVRTWLKARGVKEAFALQKNRQLGYLRERVEPHIEVWKVARARKANRAEAYPEELQLRAIQAIQSGTSISQAARDFGVSFKVAQKWLVRHSSEPGSKVVIRDESFRSKLDRHAEWIRELVLQDGSISLGDIVGRLWTEKKVKTSSTAMWQCLERHKIAIVGRRRSDPLLLAAE